MMRIRRLDLTRYGKFTDHVIDFGKRIEGRPDLHVIYGPNEAGKSTTLAAVLDLLFGIEMRSSYGFLHPHPTMRLGAALEFATGEREIVRIKRPQNSLLDNNAQPMPETVLRAGLSQVDRDAYRTMFSLDDDTLEAGGESILASEGDLGELLFSASAGLADVGRRLGGLKSEADAFYKKRARSGELGDLKDELEALKAERAKTDTLAGRYAQMFAARQSAADRYEEAIGARGRTRARIDEIKRLLNALPRLAALRSTRTNLALMQDLPEPPTGVAAELSALQKSEIELATRSENIDEIVRGLACELAAADPDDTALELVDRASGLPDLRARYLTAAKDIPERRLQIREAEAAIAGILRRIGCAGEADPQRLVLGPSVVGALRDLLENRSGIESALQMARTEVSSARRRVEEAREKLEVSGSPIDTEAPSDSCVSTLAAALSALRSDDHRARLRLAEKALATHQETLASRVLALRPWRGSLEQLIDMSVPETFVIEGWKAKLDAVRKRIERHEQEIERLASDRQRLSAELAALMDTVGIITDSEAAAIRAERDEAWLEHRQRLSADTAERFENTLRRDDLAMGARFGHVHELARLHDGRQTSAVLAADMQRAQDLLDLAKSDLQQIEAEVAEALQSISSSFPAGASPQQLATWLVSREAALDALASVRAAQREHQTARRSEDDHVERLTAALDAMSVAYDLDAGFARLTILAQSVLDRALATRQLRLDLNAQRRELEERERILERAVAQYRKWEADWADVCSRCWLGETAGRTVSEVREILAAIADLGSHFDRRSGLLDRVSKMERDMEGFATEVTLLADELGVSARQDNLLDLAAAVDNRVRSATAARDRRTEKQQALDAARERQQALAEAVAIHRRGRDDLLAYFGVATLVEVGTALQQIERRTALCDEALALSTEIVSAIGSSTIEEAERSLEAADRAALETELAELEGRFEDQDQRSRELFTEHSKAVDAVRAIGDDDTVARIEERRRTVAIEIEEKAARYLKLRIGVAAAEHALRIYRDRHRSSMMARASDAFHTISRGAYKGLTTQPDKDGEILVAVGADGGSKVASALSKGARFQLYLALRVAGYHEFAAAHQAVPFLADDIMETFDDFRAEEALRLFAQMSQVGQVIYFTHHLHLCELVRRVCPTVTIHELPHAAPLLHLVKSPQKVA